MVLGKCVKELDGYCEILVKGEIIMLNFVCEYGLIFVCDLMVLFVYWIIFEMMLKWFDMYFFLVIVFDDYIVLYDGFENVDLVWVNFG